jgi:histidine triad (HIT) family protein
VDKLFDLPGDYLADMLLFAKPIAKAIERSFPCNRCGITVIGMEVPHAHMHLVPINNSDDLNFTRHKLKLSETEFKEIQAAIHNALDTN